MTVVLKLPPNSGHLSITDKSLRTVGVSYSEVSLCMKLWVICILECVMWVIRKICFMWKYSILVKIGESLLRVTHRCIKVTSKLILPSVSRFKFCPNYKSRVKLIFIELISDIAQTHYHNVRTILCNLLWISFLSSKKLLKVDLQLLWWVWKGW